MNKELLLVSFFNKPSCYINIGDALQTVILKKLVAQHMHCSIKYVDRPDLHTVDKVSDIIVNGYFDDKNKNSFCNKLLSYKFIAFNLFMDRIDGYIFDTRAGRIGCRDVHTYQLLKDKNIPSYISMCLTCTLDKRPQDKNYSTVYINLRKENILLKSKNALQQLFGNAEMKSIESTWKCVDKTWEQLEDIAVQHIEELRDNAKFVLTDRLHTYLPCIAMGIPCQYIGPQDYRTSLVKIFTDKTADIFRPLVKQNSLHELFGIGEDVKDKLTKLALEYVDA